jgi:protein TIF31
MSDNQETEETQQQVAQDLWPDVVDLIIELPGNKKIVLPEVSSGETLSAIRQALADFQETAFITSFKWELKGMVDIQGNQVEVAQEFLNDFTELNTFLQPNIKSCLFKIAEEQYDVKKVKAHVKRLKDISRRNFLISAAPKDAKKDKKSGPETNETEEKTAKKESKLEPLPKFEKLLEPSLLGNFFQKVFAEPGKPADNKPAVASEPLNSVIKSVFVSGWNPPPSNRRLQGDLLYVEVVLANEGTVYLTATSRGFYVNRSNRTTFDPRPANNPHFAHTLFQTLLSFSANLRTAWTNLCTYSEQHQFSSGPLSQLETQFQNFQGDVNTLPPNTWLMNPEIKNQSSYDLFRAQEHLSDLLGADELGAPREWNDEIQSIRSLPASELGEKIVKARLEHRVSSLNR